MTGIAALSAHEYRIARQAAGGTSNQDIGDGLGVSARAVEHHLTSAYRKLGIGGRDQLRHALRTYTAQPTGRPHRRHPGTGAADYGK